MTFSISRQPLFHSVRHNSAPALGLPKFIFHFCQAWFGSCPQPAEIHSSFLSGNVLFLPPACRNSFHHCCIQAALPSLFPIPLNWAI